MRMYRVILAVGTFFYPFDGATGFTLTPGWNWVAIRVETIWGYTYIKFYHSDETYTTGNRQGVF